MRRFTSLPIVLIFSFTLFFFFFFSVSSAGDSINQTQLITDTDGGSLVSAGGSFKLGFFSPGSSKNRYLSIWYTFSVKTIVWVANRDDPIPDSTGVLKIESGGNVTLSYQKDRVVWSSNTSNAKNPLLQLLESGNLIVKDAASSMTDAPLWQSFDHPTDTMLLDTKLGWNLQTGLNRFLRSWKDTNDPSAGDYFYTMNSNGSHEIDVRSSQRINYRLGPLDGLRFSGIPKMAAYDMFRFNFVSTQEEVCYTFEATTKGVISRLVLHPTGVVERLGWSNESQTWNPYWTAPKDECDGYAKCGPNGVCDNEAPETCQCYRGFNPKSPNSWHVRDYRLGCEIKVKLDCSPGEGFVQVTGVKLAETTNSKVIETMSLDECRVACLKDCSCSAYAPTDINGTWSGCIMRSGDLIDTRKFKVDGQDLFLRLVASELDKSKRKHDTSVIVTGIVLGLVLVVLCGSFVWIRKKKSKQVQRATVINYYDDSSKWKDDLPLFDFDTIASTTGHFSIENKIGEGGFGSVYKGTMADGQEIAVKGLSRTSGQGLDEFMNEVMLIVKLQHQNLVRLLGCCIEGEERMLVYEFMKNKSLDAFIFEKGGPALLDWRKLVDIISGVARGLLYLHQDSRFRIIDRDLKAGNVLLDEAMNPKISDFGTARIFGADQMEENTGRVIGTYGYMSPEYAMDGIFSVKSDVFSFGVLLLEIISLRTEVFRNIMRKSLSLPFVVIFFSTLLSISSGLDTINQTQTLGINQTLVSSNNVFVLGFFIPVGSNNRYLGIWYMFSSETVVWVANREKPIPADSTVALKISGGNLALVHQNETILLSSNSIPPSPITLTVKLLDTGNLVLGYPGKNDSVTSVWQSFDHPTDTLLPTMKVGFNLTSNITWLFTAWNSDSDPSPGKYICKMDPRGLHEIYLREAQEIDYRFGPWNGLRFSGIPRMAAYSFFKYSFVFSQEEVYYSFNTITDGVFARVTLFPNGSLERLVWTKDSPAWTWEQGDECDKYAKCGPNGICDTQTPGLCACYRGFTPNDTALWNNRDFALGCVRKQKLNCSDPTGFLQLQEMKLPDTTNSTRDMSMSLDQCKDACFKNCSCTAYAAVDINGTGCFMWFGDLIDTKYLRTDGQDLYLKLPASELDKAGVRHKKTVIIIIVIAAILGLLLVSLCVILVRRRKKKIVEAERGIRMEYYEDYAKWKDEVSLFQFTKIAIATDNFSNENKLGQGGFGSVYKGIMEDGQEIAVKRLITISGQGLDEFMNEIKLIARLQHRNLVRLLGCCIERQERILVYEFMKNKSLDAFIFDESKRAQLDWRKWMNIILGIARGLLYLHQDSRLKVIHRDLKAGNVLLDEGMNPKISDFGTARIFGVDQSEANTERVVGTYGYMSPEYAMDGIFSTGSDVFSFGVLLLEIVSGKKNRVISKGEQDLNLLALAWRLWQEGNSLELLDATITCSASTSEVLRCVQIGLLCVQECAEDRPTMASVVFMLSHDTSPMVDPKRPGFIKRRRTAPSETSTSSQQASSSSYSINDVTITKMRGR